MSSFTSFFFNAAFFRGFILPRLNALSLALEIDCVVRACLHKWSAVSFLANTIDQHLIMELASSTWSLHTINSGHSQGNSYAQRLDLLLSSRVYLHRIRLQGILTHPPWKSSLLSTVSHYWPGFLPEIKLSQLLKHVSLLKVKGYLGIK